MIICNTKDKERLRSLGKQVKELSELPVMQKNIALWRKVNDLNMERPLLHHRDTSVAILNYNNELTPQIEDPFLKNIELDLLLRIYNWKHMPLNYVVSNKVKCQCVIQDTEWGNIAQYRGVQGNIATEDLRKQKTFHFTASIKSIEDVEKILTPQVSHDEKSTMERYHLLKDIFDGILEVKLFGKQYFRVAPWDDIMNWLGMGDAMLYFYTEPEMMHACIDRYMKAAISWVKQYEALGLLSSNNDFENVLNNDPGYTSQLPLPTESGIGCKLKDIWGATSDQILTSVSPALTKEYAFDYEQEFSQLFGLYGYGCCERLDKKLDDLKAAFPNLRKVSVSPFSNMESCFEQLGKDYVACFKPNSNILVLDNFEESKEYLTKELENAIRMAIKYDNNLVINMKTIIDLHDDPARLWWWCDMATKMVDKYY
ncbi:MAG: hypothetical protein AB7D36_08365 [Oscillospiraceae bacterium]